MLNVDQLIASFKEALGWPYKSPGGTDKDCSKSGIDCSGMFVRAYKIQGQKIAHGSNTMWRDGSLSEKGVLTKVSQLEPGMAVFLCKPWEEKDSSNKYYGDKEGNMSHVGLVVATNPLRIIDASYSAGKVRETKVLKTVGWNRWGRLAALGAEPTAEKKESTNRYKVIGGGLNVRTAPSRGATRLGQLPDGTVVDVKNIRNGWAVIEYSGRTCYVCADYLEVTNA